MTNGKGVLLLSPPSYFGGLDAVINAYPLGLTYLAAMVDEICSVRILDAKAEQLGLDDILRRIIGFEPEIVGVSNITSVSTNIGLNVARRVKEVLPETMVVFGGHHATFAADELLRTGVVDVVVRGEGELSFKELVEGRPLAKIQGISFRKGNGVFHCSARPLIENLDSQPFPARHLLNHHQYHAFGIPGDIIETSRGCPYECIFCSIPQFHGNRWRARSPRNILSEIKHVINQYHSEAIFFADDNFTVDMQRVGELCDLITESKIKAYLFCQARVDSIANHPKIVKKMQKAGFWLVFLGIESPFQDFLDKIQKKIAINQIRTAVNVLKETEIGIWGAFIIGFPSQSERSILQTAEFAKELDVEIAQFTLLTPLLGSKLYQQCAREGKLLTRDWRKYTLAEPVMDIGIPPKRLEKLFAASYKRFYRRLSYPIRMIISGRKHFRNPILKYWKYWLKLAILGKPY